MSAHQSAACCSVPPVVGRDYKAKGEYETINGFKTYVTGPSDAKSAILYIYDIFGFFPQSIQGADILSAGDKENKHLVLMPDWFKGQPFPLADFPPDNDDKKKKLGEFFETTGNAQTTAEAVPKFVDAVRAQHPSIQSFFVAGFCWGGKIAALTSKADTKFKAAAVAHPAMVDPSEAPSITIPYALLPSKDEDEETVEKFKAALKVKGLVEKFPTQIHGWMSARSDLDKEEVRKEYERGYKTMLDWFHQAL